MHGVYLVLFRLYEGAKVARPALSESRLVAGAWRLMTLIAITAAWVPFRAPSIHKAVAILSSMFLRFTTGTAYGGAFYAFTTAVMLFCAVEPYLVQKLSEIEERASLKSLFLFRILGRPLVYACGLLLFMLFDEHNTQFIYSQF